MAWLVSLSVIFTGLFILTRFEVRLVAATAAFLAALLSLTLLGLMPGLLGWVLWPLAMALVLLNIPALCRRSLSAPMLSYIRQVLPPMSETERQAIEAGTVWWESALFRGNPDWNNLLRIPVATLSNEEQAFMDGPVEALCAMLDDWQITDELNDMPRAVWEFMARERFWAINIPRQCGGLEFSPEANSAIVLKVCSRSGTAGVMVMVPNSLGPAELLLHYGTAEQKEHYLPRLAHGDEIPCFGLTNPLAGSDAGAIPDYGVVCEAEFEGRTVLGLRLAWEKRYITLGPVATLLGLAFKAYDPDHLLGGVEDLGITCALIPTTTPGIAIGNRHYPSNAAFQNGPNSGKDVFIPLDWVVGGGEGLGGGWRMLVESLAVGRGISLPASAVAAAKVAARATGAYASVREQFGIAIGRFEGVSEALARVGGLTYLMDAARLLTTSGLKLGERPSVVTAIIKYHLTESARRVLNDAMDIHGGRAICLGPSNYLARSYQQIPIAITVEGANILTRTLMIFGQGAMRCHPYLLKEINAASNMDGEVAELEFDEALLGHMGYTTVNAARSLVFGLSMGYLAQAPAGRGRTARYYRDFGRFSAAFALLADIALLILGGALKRKEMLSGRFADALSYLYLGTAVLKHHENHDRPATDLPLVDWSCQYCLQQIEDALDGILRNFPLKVPAVLLRAIVFPLGRRHRAPSDALAGRVSELLLTPSETRNRITAGIFLNPDERDILGRLEDALAKVIAAKPARKKLKDRGHLLPDRVSHEDWIAGLLQQGIIAKSDADALNAAHAAALKVIAVDDFPPAPADDRTRAG